MKARLVRVAALFSLLGLAACGGGPTPTLPAPTVIPPTATAAGDDSPVLPTPIPTLALPPPPTAPPTPAGLDPAQQVAIYATVVHDLAEAPRPPYIGIAPTASQGELLDTPAPDRPIPPALIDALHDLTATVELVPFMEAIGPLEQGGHVRNNGVFITLGVLQTDPAGPDKVALYASLYRASDDATGYRYELTRTAGVWTITSRTQTWDQ